MTKKDQEIAGLKVIDGLEKEEHESTEDVEKKAKNVLINNLNVTKNELEHEFDKCHRVGKIKYGKQPIIMRFKSRGFRSRVYNRSIKVHVSLTKTRLNMLGWMLSSDVAGVLQEAGDAYSRART